MFCGFGPGPRILRLFCRGEVLEVGGEGFGGLVARMGLKGGEVEGARAVVLLRVFKVCACVGFSFFLWFSLCVFGTAVG